MSVEWLSNRSRMQPEWGNRLKCIISCIERRIKKSEEFQYVHSNRAEFSPTRSISTVNSFHFTCSLSTLSFTLLQSRIVDELSFFEIWHLHGSLLTERPSLIIPWLALARTYVWLVREQSAPSYWRSPPPLMSFMSPNQQCQSTDDRTRCYRRIFSVCCMLPIFLYGSECWAITKEDARRINALHQWCLCMLLGISGITSSPMMKFDSRPTSLYLLKLSRYGV